MAAQSKKRTNSSPTESVTKSFSTRTIIESPAATLLVSSCCPASKSRKTDSSPWPGIHRHQRGPTTEDYHTIGSQTLMTWKVTNSQQADHSAASQGKPTDCNSHLAQSDCLHKRGRKSCLASKHCKHCSGPWGREVVERRQDEPDADKYRDLDVGTSGWIRQTPLGILSQNISHHDDADKQEDWL